MDYIKLLSDSRKTPDLYPNSYSVYVPQQCSLSNFYLLSHRLNECTVRSKSTKVYVTVNYPPGFISFSHLSKPCRRGRRSHASQKSYIKSVHPWLSHCKLSAFHAVNLLFFSFQHQPFSCYLLFYTLPLSSTHSDKI